MTHTELLIKAITWDNPETIPVSIGLLPALWLKYPKEIREITARYRQFFGDLSEKYNYETYTRQTYHTGDHTDEWGCVWSNIAEGQEAIVKVHPVKTREEIRKLKIPDDRTGRMYHGFMYLRVLDLRGFENAMEDFADEPPELQILLDRVLEYNMIQLEIKLKTAREPLMYFGDDLGMQTGLAIGRQKWLRYFKPCYEKLFKMVHDKGKLVYMHTDGCIWEIMNDLKEAGADMINPQYRANGLENLARVCIGKIPIDLDLDRQYLPFTNPEGIDEHIRQCIQALYLPRGGLGVKLELGPDVSLEVIEAALAALEKYRHFKTC